MPMYDKMPEGGWPLRLAITHLVRDPVRDNARMYFELEQRGYEPAASKRHLWNDIAAQLMRGDLIAEGARGGSLDTAVIPAKFFLGAVPNYDADTLTSGGVTFHRVRVFAASGALAKAVASPPEASSPPINRKCSAAEVTSFYRNRVETWPEGTPPPTQDRDIADALAHFADRAPSRARLRSARQKLGPATWQLSRGRPKKSPN